MRYKSVKDMHESTSALSSKRHTWMSGQGFINDYQTAVKERHLEEGSQIFELIL